MKIIASRRIQNKGSGAPSTNLKGKTNTSGSITEL
jgi:hypothetical protein